MPDYHKVCWNCGSERMVSRGDFSQCLDCEATYNDLPAPGHPLLLLESREPSSKPFQTTDKIARPTKSAQRRAARARGEGK